MNGSSMSTTGRSRERFLVVKGSGGAGLGDKLRAVISAIVYARLSGRALYIDWNDPAYGDGVLNYFDALFRLEGVQMAIERPTGGTVRPPAWQGKLHLNWDRLYAEHGIPPWNRAWAVETFSFDQSVPDWPEDVCVMWDFDQFGKLVRFLPRFYPAIRGGEPSELMQGAVLRTHVKPSAEIAAGLAYHLHRFHSARPVVGVHVRAAEDNFRIRSAPPVSAYVKAVEEAMRHSGAQSIFLATDNRDVQDLFKARFGEQSVFWAQKWLPEPGMALQLENGCPDRLQAARDAVLDVLLLASADYLVTMGNSSFSMLARMFSPVPEDRRITLRWRAPLWRRLLRKTGWGRK
jgi:hypothetical protein